MSKKPSRVSLLSEARGYKKFLSSRDPEGDLANLSVEDVRRIMRPLEDAINDPQVQAIIAQESLHNN